MKRAAGLLLALALPLAACGGDDDSTDTTAAAATSTATDTSATDTSATDTSATDTAGQTPGTTVTDEPTTTAGDSTATTMGGDAAPTGNATVHADGSITVTHKYGTTTLGGQPERIVSLDTQWTDTLIALDAPPAATAVSPYLPESEGVYPWQEDGVLPDSVERIEVDPSGVELPFEAVAALQPDLIVVTWAVTDEAQYDRLSQIAPTIPLLGDRQVDRWQDLALVAGALIGDPAKGAALVAEAQADAAALAAELPGLDGKTYAMANYQPGTAITVVADPEDGAATLFGELGLSIDPDLLAIADGASGRVDLSLERIGELDADLLIMLTNGADTDEIPGYSALPAVQRGAVALMSYGDVVGLNTPTPLSVPYALDLIRPALEAAAG